MMLYSWLVHIRGRRPGILACLLIVLVVTTACQIEISTHKSVEAVATLPTGTPVPPAPSPTFAPTGSPVVETIAPTATPPPSPVPTELPATPTATPQLFIPAQQPPDGIIIPAIGLTTTVTRTTWITIEQNGQTGTVWHVPDFAAGWHVNSALPGHNSNVVLSGHHNIKGEVFRDIVNLNPGDDIILHADGQNYNYRVTNRFIIPDRDIPEAQRRQNALWIMPTVDERLTLVTCYPYTDNSHRVIVIAKPVAGPQTAATLP